MSTLTDFLLARIAEEEAVALPHPRPGRPPRFRWVAECEAKRRIVERAAALCLHGDGWVREDGEFVLRALALPHADHPDFDEAWRA